MSEPEDEITPAPMPLDAIYLCCVHDFPYLYDTLFELVERLYIGEHDFVGSIAESLRFPDWMERERAGFWQFLGMYPCTKVVDGEDLNTELPLTATISFYRRPYDNQIAAIANCCSLYRNEGELKWKLLELFPRVKADELNKLYTGNSIHYDYQNWLLHKTPIGA